MADIEHIKQLLQDVQDVLTEGLRRSASARFVIVTSTDEAGPDAHAPPGPVYITAVNADHEEMASMLAAAHYACGGALATTTIDTPPQ